MAHNDDTVTHNMDTRVTILEHDMEHLRKLPIMFHELDKKIDRILEMKQCPVPGLCVELDHRITSLETTRSETKGGWRIITLLSGLAGGVSAWLVNHFTNTKHP